MEYGWGVMSTARAAVAGMLAAILGLEIAGGGDLDQESVLLGLVIVAIIILLIVPDAVTQYRKFRHHAQEEAKALMEDKE